MNIPGNYYDKYHTKNPIAKWLLNGFKKNLLNLIERIDFQKVIEAGCGEGEITNLLKKYKPHITIKGFDIDEEIIREAQRRFPHFPFFVASIYQIPYPDKYFDLVVACEVLEHLEEPEKAIVELSRVSNKYVLLSVPREPIWRILNIARGKYISALGNTPGHIQHWTKKRFVSMVSRHLQILEITNPFPWTMVLCKVKRQAEN